MIARLVARPTKMSSVADIENTILTTPPEGAMTENIPQMVRLLTPYARGRLAQNLGTANEVSQSGEFTRRATPSPAFILALQRLLEPEPPTNE